MAAPRNPTPKPPSSSGSESTSDTSSAPGESGAADDDVETSAEVDAGAGADAPSDDSEDAADDSEDAADDSEDAADNSEDAADNSEDPADNSEDPADNSDDSAPDGSESADDVERSADDDQDEDDAAIRDDADDSETSDDDNAAPTDEPSAADSHDDTPGATLPSRPEPELSAPPPKAAASAPGRVWVVNRGRVGFISYLLRYLLLTAVLAVLAVGVGGVSLYRYFAADIPPLADIERYQALAPGVTRIYARGGATLAELAREHRSYARYDQMPEPLVHAFLSVEDRRFFTHGGLDYRGLARAAVANYRSGTVSQGGSTITQQVAKSFLTQDQTITRKLKEAILSVRIESRLSKEQILEIYLNKIFLGHGAFGVAAAASRYFGKELEDLTLAESALIAGLARAPSRYSPVSNPERALRRRSVVLRDMVEAGYIDEDTRAEADAEPLTLVGSGPDVFRMRAPYFAEHARLRVTAELGEDAVLQRGLQIETTLEPLVQQMAARSVETALRKIERKQGYRGPVTSLRSDEDKATFLARTKEAYGSDPLATQERRRLAVVTKTNKFNAWVKLGDTEALLPLRGMRWAAKFDRNSGVNERTIADVREALEPGDVVWVRRAKDDYQARPPAGSEELKLVEVQLEETPRVEAALYTFEHETGYVNATQGGHDYDRSQFNRSVQGCRQPGSVFKAIYYAYALDTGKYSMGSVLEDRAYEPDPGEEWNPQNIHGTIEGKVLLRNAFIFSLNLPSIRLFVRLGADNVVKWARGLGFTTELIADKALSLGASCVRMDELSRAFGIYASQGRQAEQVYIRRITDKEGAVVLDRRHAYDGAMDLSGRVDAVARRVVAPPKQVIEHRTAFLITQMLRDVVTSGIGRRAQRVGVPAGGKSGTASKNEFTTDTWFVGFTSRYVTAAWMGDDKYERSLGDEEASYTTATPMWADYMGSVVEGVPHERVPLQRPAGIRSKMVQFMAGDKQRQAVLYFKGSSTAPDKAP